MPPYPWLITDDLDISTTADKINVLRMLGTPYEEGYEEIANDDLMAQAKQVAKRLRADGIEQENLETKEIVAIIAYLQRLGTDIKPQPQANQ
jgi:cytochrome c oxidase cbb3-type subunit I/II